MGDSGGLGGWTVGPSTPGIFWHIRAGFPPVRTGEKDATHGGNEEDTFANFLVAKCHRRAPASQRIGTTWFGLRNLNGFGASRVTCVNLLDLQTFFESDNVV